MPFQKLAYRLYYEFVSILSRILPESLLWLSHSARNYFPGRRSDLFKSKSFLQPRRHETGCRLPFTVQLFLPLILLAGSLLFFSCSFQAPTQSLTANQPQKDIIDVQPPVVKKALLQVLDKKNFKINTARTDQQNFETEWLEDGQYRSMVQAEILPVSKYRTQVILNLLVEKKGLLQKTWQPENEIEKTVYSDLMHEIVMESYRILYDKR